MLIVPRVLLARRHGRSWLTRSPARPTRPATPGSSRRPGRSPRRPRVRWSDGSLSAPQWEQAVAAAVAAIRAGQLSKVVLARDLQATASAPIDARMLLARLAARYPDCYTFSCSGLVGATPELYIRREGEQVTSLVLAGDRAARRQRDRGRRARRRPAVLGQERQEHGYAVADVRAALEPLCAELAVAREACAVPANVQHLATGVTGVLGGPPGDRPSALGLAAALHPTPAVCGTPRGRPWR